VYRWRGTFRTGWRDAAGRARDHEQSDQRESGELVVGGLHPAGARRLAKGAAATTTLGISEIGKDGRERALTLPDGAIRRVDLAEAAAKVQFSRRGTAPAHYVVNESGFDRNPPTAEMSQGVEIIREFLDAKGNPSRVTVGEEFGPAARARHHARSTTANRDRRSAAGPAEPVLIAGASRDRVRGGCS
jgi:hypothetical protein